MNKRMHNLLVQDRERPEESETGSESALSPIEGYLNRVVDAVIQFLDLEEEEAIAAVFEFIEEFVEQKILPPLSDDPDPAADQEWLAAATRVGFADAVIGALSEDDEE